MNLTLHIPDDIAIRLSVTVSDLERDALEALALEKFRAGRLNKDELAQILDLDGGAAIDGFLKAHGAYEPNIVEDVACDAATLAQPDLVEADPINLAEAIRRRFAPVGGVDDLVILPREHTREPLRFDR